VTAFSTSQLHQRFNHQTNIVDTKDINPRRFKRNEHQVQKYTLPGVDDITTKSGVGKSNNALPVVIVSGDRAFI